MLAAGWIEEVRQLIARGIPADAKPFQFIGYSQLRAHLQGGLSREAAMKQIQQATRRFAKRQITWFRKIRASTGFRALAMRRRPSPRPCITCRENSPEDLTLDARLYNVLPSIRSRMASARPSSSKVGPASID